MRSAFVNAIIKAAKRDKRIVLLTGDLGFAVLEPFRDQFPDRFLNLGIAEQNLVGFAAGLAMTGKIPVVYSIATFATLKTVEQVRNDVCYQGLNVKLVGVGSGLTYSLYGATHHALEDIAIMRTLPNFKVLCPGDPFEVEAIVPAMLADSQPAYLRIGAKGEPRVHRAPPPLTIGKGLIVREGVKVALITTGNILANALAAADLLAAQHIRPRVISMHTVKPIDRRLLEQTFRRFRHIFTIEEHTLIGGLGSAVAEVIAERPRNLLSFVRIALPDQFQKTAGWLEFLRERNQLSPRAIARRVSATIRRTS